MKKIILAFCLCVTLLQAQTLKYQKVQITGEPGIAKQLLQLGITIDHADVHENSITTEISENEVLILKQHHIHHTILIEDLSKFYLERNKADLAGKMAMPTPVCNAQNIAKPANFHLGSMGGFFTWNEMKQILDSMALLYPNLISVKQPLSQQSIQGRDIYYVRMSDNPTVDENEPELLYTALHHAREPASLSQLIFYMWYLLENYATDPDIAATLNNTELYFVPCVNPDGYVYNATTNPGGGGMWRKNRRLNSDNTYGVDLNRNYGYNWGYDNTGSSPTTSSDTYRGTAGFSEPEIQAMRDFCNSRQFATALNAHTYGNLLIYPWGYLPSIYTPDSATFVNWTVLLTEDSRFLYGTGDQTVNYVTNGDSDDWMYGEQSSKPKILSMTPEAGASGDGFWPASSRILDICKTTFTQNYNLAKLVGRYAIARDMRDKFISSNGYLNYSLQRLGLSSGNFTVSINPVGSGIVSAGAPKSYSLSQNQLINDSISFTLNTGLAAEQTVKYAIGVDNGYFTHYDTITKIYGTPVILASNNGTVVAGTFTTSGTWGLSTTKFVSPPSSITESPAGNYLSNQNKSITLSTPVNLTNAIYAHLQYYTRFELEKNYDQAKILYSTNNGVNWNPLCGRYETSPASSGATSPVYDGFQDGWVKEDIDISAYAGQNFLIRFTFTSDGGLNKDGFYFDDLLIRKLTSTASGIASNIFVNENIIISPNPSTGIFNLSNPDLKSISLVVLNAIGQEIYKKDNIYDANYSIDLKGEARGIYFVKVKVDGNEIVKKVVLSN
ncbi:MAG: immune inhibitor A [Bacteroidetes bacterium]|nr:immune inhibitor A [Bacteroidota bacterium]